MSQSKPLLYKSLIHDLRVCPKILYMSSLTDNVSMHVYEHEYGIRNAEHMDLFKGNSLCNMLPSNNLHL